MIALQRRLLQSTAALMVSAGPALPTPLAAYQPGLDTTGTGAVQNRAADASAFDPNEYLNIPKGTILFLGSVQATLTAAAGTGPEGQTTAARAQFSTPANFGLAAQLQNIRLAAGTYTLQFDIACTPAAPTNQTIRCGLSSSLQAVTVASATWGQKFTQTFTIGTTGNYSLYIVHEDGAKSSYDVLFDNVRLYVGSSVPAMAPTSAHLRFGATPATTTNPTLGTKLPANSPFGVSTFSTSKTISAFTCVVAFSQTGSTSGGWFPFLTSWENYNHFRCALGNTNNAHLAFNNDQMNTTHLSFNGKGWGILTYRVKNGVQDICLNGVILSRKTSSVSASTISKLVYGGFQLSGGITSINVPADMGPMALYDQYLTDAELAVAINDVKTKLTSSGQSLATQKPLYLANGDSITIAANSYAFRMLDARASTIPGAVFATNGVSIATIASDITSWQIGPIQNAVALGGVPIVSVLTGANDSSVGTNPTAFYNTLVSLFQSIRTAGGKVLACTVLPKNDGTFNTGRATVNSMLRADASQYDALADLDTCAAGTDASAANVTYYSDGVHPTSAGYDAITPVTQAALDAIVAAIP